MGHAIRVIIVLWAILGLSALSVRGSSIAETPEDGLSVSDSNYRQVIIEGNKHLNCYVTYPQGSAEMLMDFGANASELKKLDSFIRQVFQDSLIITYISSVQLCGYCSVEGSYKVNDQLAQNRVYGFKNYLERKYALSSYYPVEVTWVAEDWDGLYKMVDQSDMDYRQEILSLIDHVGVFEGREKNLIDLAGGAPYKYMMKEFFPALRRVEITVNYDLRRIMEEKFQRSLSEEEFQAALMKERAAAEAEAARIATEQAAAEEQARLQAAELAQEQAEAQYNDAAEVHMAAIRQKKDARKLYPLIGIKTDLVAWTGLTDEFKMTNFMPNLEAEVYFADRWSVNGTALYSNWSYKSDKEFWGKSAYSIEPRYWFRKDGLFRGFYVGLYGEVGDFNRQKNRIEGTTTTTNYTGTFWSTGFSAGYVQTLSKHWYLELTARVGYRGVDYKVYDRDFLDGLHLYYDHSDKKDEFTLTGLRLNVVYRFGRPDQGR